MKSFKLLLIIFVLFTACKKQQNNEIIDNTSVVDYLSIKKADISKLNYKDIGLDAKVNPITSTWQAYLDIANGIENIKQADFTLINSDKDLFNSTIRDFEETIPEAVNSEPIKARILALKTFLYKFQEIEGLKTSTKTEKLKTIKEVLAAFSNLNLQINKKIEKDAQNIEKPY